ncbi:MAG: glycerophosphodiester phosphodiesterase family protein [Clostridium sp.]|nr:glycerophosphodiester phosphodiesterase family protein [Clostridium sp.]MDU7083168.1 glycerophosphodiester phosphodiesterase family protein [Clostridium sp.]
MMAIMIILFLAAIIIFLIYPKRCTKTQEMILDGVNYAHRGLHSKDKSVPENSISAFRLAVEKGYGIELDVILSKDGEVMVFHDDTLERICGISRNFEECTLRELKQMKLCNTAEEIPTFQEVLNIVDEKVPIIIEVKSGKRNKELCEKVLDHVREYKGDYCIESFNPFIVLWFRKNSPQIMRGQLMMDRKRYKNVPKWMGFVMSNALANVISRPNFIAYGTGKKSFLLRSSERLGAMKVVWTVNDTLNYRKYEEENHAVIFEYYEPKSKYR